MRRLIGLRDFVHDAIEKTTDLVEQTHEAAAKKPVRALSYFEPLSSAVRGVDDARRLTAKAVFDSIRGTNRAVQAISDVGVTLAAQALEAVGAHQREPSEAAQTVGAWVDRAESALNAVCGDFLEARDNALSIKMSIRHDGHDLIVTPEALALALPHANGKLCIFVHGLGCSDSIWRAGDAPGTSLNFGSELDTELGYTSLYARYNTGLHISQNGRSLALLLERLEQAFPCTVSEIALVGHSMGGLVARSAAHYGRALDHGWSRKLTHLLCIGSPHFGTPLERAGNVLTSVLAFFDTAGTQVPAKVFNARSAGIKDLRFGSIVDEDWLDKDPDAFFTDTSQHAPFVEGVTYGYIAARYHDDSSRFGELLGDLLVQIPSASGAHRDATRRLPFHMGTLLERVHHVSLTNHPAVYEQLKRFLTWCRADVVAREALERECDGMVDADTPAP